MDIFDVSSILEEIRLLEFIHKEDIFTKQAVQSWINDVKWYNFHVATHRDRNVLTVRCLANRHLAIYRQAINKATGRIFCFRCDRIVLFNTHY